MRGSLLAAAAAAVAIGLAAADTPNHCLWTQVAPASWTLYVSPLGSNGSLVCPQQVNDVPVSAELEVYLDEPDIVRSGPGGERIGWWSMLYDEGAHIVLDSVPAGMPTPLHFFSFFNWTTDASGNVTSFCNITNPGNVFNEPAPGVAPESFGCYFGLQTSQPSQTPITKAALRAPAPVPAAARVREDPEFAARINAAAKGLWTSSARSAFHGLPLSTARKHAGKFRQYRHAETLPRLANGQRLRASSSAAAAVTDLPTAWDWRNASGSNFVCPVRNQGNCGSCYSFGSTGSLCARSMIATQGAVSQYWSPQSVVSCNPWTQGCDGGYGYDVFLWGMASAGIPFESCFPYSSGAAGAVPPCANKCADAAQYNRVTSPVFVGGFYGGATAEAMQAEIYANGPISVEFEVLPSFQHYTGGIYAGCSTLSPEVERLSIQPWELVNHEVMIVGWGEENGTPYWTVQNSWGTTFGEDGYFRILRGSDECAIESIPMAGVPVLGAHGAALAAKGA